MIDECLCPMTSHEKECAIAAIAVRIEAAKTSDERREWRAFYREIIEAPLEYNE